MQPLVQLIKLSKKYFDEKTKKEWEREEKNKAIKREGTVIKKPL